MLTPRFATRNRNRREYLPTLAFSCGFACRTTRAFPGKVDAGLPQEMRSTLDSRAHPRFHLIGMRSKPDAAVSKARLRRTTRAMTNHRADRRILLAATR